MHARSFCNALPTANKWRSPHATRQPKPVGIRWPSGGCNMLNRSSIRRRATQERLHEDRQYWLMRLAINLPSRFGFICPKPDCGIRCQTLPSVLSMDSSRSRYPAISVQRAEVALAKSDSMSIAYEFRTKPANREVWRQTGQERGFRVAADAAQCGGSYANARSYCLFLPA
jgi:hypothetical protein